MGWNYFASCEESDDAEFNAPYIEGWTHFANSSQETKEEALKVFAYLWSECEHRAEPFFPGRGVRWAIYAKTAEIDKQMGGYFK